MPVDLSAVRLTILKIAVRCFSLVNAMATLFYTLHMSECPRVCLLYLMRVDWCIAMKMWPILCLFTASFAWLLLRSMSFMAAVELCAVLASTLRSSTVFTVY